MASTCRSSASVWGAAAASEWPPGRPAAVAGSSAQSYPEEAARLRRCAPPPAAAPGLLLAYGVVQILWGEAIESTGGLGFYDGRRYGEIAMDFHGQVFREGLDAYRLQRVLPSAIVHAWLRVDRPAPGRAARARHVPHLQPADLLVTAAAWAAIARAMELRSAVLLARLRLLFLNFANLKMPFYNAVLTDTTALVLGTLLVLLLPALERARRCWPSSPSPPSPGRRCWRALSSTCFRGTTRRRRPAHHEDERGSSARWPRSRVSPWWPPIPTSSRSGLGPG